MPVPTVDDLRVKLCYICREEEIYNQSTSPPRTWVHPCNCTLIAHESCLLEWIKTSESNPSKKSSEVLKCPQCGAKYELESQNPLILRAMQTVERTLSLFGRGVTITSIGAIVASFGAGVYLLSTAYGVFAMQQFLGDEMFQMLLSDDPSKWPLHSWINLPLIPVSLILGRTKMFKHALPLGPLMFFWPGVPVNVSSTPIDFLPDVTTQGELSFSNITSRAMNPVLSSWPPSPLLFSLCTMIISPYYSYSIKRFRRWIMNIDGDVSDTRGGIPVVRRLMFEGWNMEMRVEGDILDNGARPAPEAIQNRGVNGNNGDDEQARVPAQPNGRVDRVNALNQQNNPGQIGVPPLGGDVLAEGQEAPLGVPPQHAAAAPVRVRAAEEQPAALDPLTIRITGAEIGRVIAGALLIPPITNLFGSVLLRLSRHSLRLRRFLGIRDTIYQGPVQYYVKNNVKISAPYQIFSGLASALSSVGAGSPAWRNSDPVWWRNSLGYGFWILTCDLISLWREWLAKRDLESRKLRNMPFDGVDPAELDLITPPVAATS